MKTDFEVQKIKLLLLLLLYPAVTVSSKDVSFAALADFNVKKRNMLVNILINKLFEYIRHVIRQGSPIVGIPKLDPFTMEDYHLVIPTGLFNLDLRFKNVSVIGFGRFVLHRNNLHLSNLTFEIEISLPRVVISAESINISEVVNGFIPMLSIIKSKDKTELEMENFRLQANLQLKQSDDEKSILIDKIEQAYFDIPSFKINSDGGVIRENLENFTVLDQELLNYVESCKDNIVQFISNAILTFGNPILNRLDTWRYIGVLL